ncbi:IS66 family transposase [Cupriavidus basilensis]
MAKKTPELQVPDLKSMTHEQKDAFIIELVAMVNMLLKRVDELEARLGKDSHNSSKPPSSDGLRRKPKSLRERGKAKAGGQPGHKGNTLKRVEQPDHVEIHSVAPLCDACGQPIAREDVSILAESRQVIDLPPIRFEVTEHRVEQAQCGCGKVHRAAFPAGVSQAAQYGSQIKAAVVYLTQYQQLPVDRTTQALADLFGVRLSTGTVQNCINEAAIALKPAVAQIRQALQEAAVAHFDESGVHVAGKLHWLHSVSTAMLSWLGAHQKRGKEAMDSHGILPAFTGVAAHDGWAPYAHYECEHALCNAHHLRELIFISETTQQPWTAKLIALLRQACGEVDRSIDQGAQSLPKQRQRYYRQRSSKLIAEGRRLNPQQQRAPSQAKQRGKIKQSPAFNLLARLERHADQVWRFIADHRVPFTNNQAERDIRMPKLKQKVSGCFRSQNGLDAFCTIRSYLGTLRKQSRPLFEALAHAFTGNVLSPMPAE